MNILNPADQAEAETKLAEALRIMLNDAKEFGPEYAAEKAAKSIVRLLAEIAD